MFADTAVDAVLAEYAARIEREKRRAAGAVDRDALLLPIGPEAGRFLHGLIIARRPRSILELGTSYGYSTLFLADAARIAGAEVITIEIADYKQAEARSMIGRAGLSDVVDFRLGDAIETILADPGPFDFVLLDIWKELYLPCLRAFYPKLSDEAVIAADNMIEPAMHRDDARAYRAAVSEIADLSSILLPIGSGIELSVRWNGDNGKL